VRWLVAAWGAQVDGGSQLIANLASQPQLHAPSCVLPCFFWLICAKFFCACGGLWIFSDLYPKCPKIAKKSRKIAGRGEDSSLLIEGKVKKILGGNCDAIRRWGRPATLQTNLEIDGLCNAAGRGILKQLRNEWELTAAVPNQWHVVFSAKVLRMPMYWLGVEGWKWDGRPCARLQL
jgi:hypothetical protein